MSNVLRTFTIIFFCFILISPFSLDSRSQRNISWGTPVALDLFVVKVNDARASNGLVRVKVSASLENSSTEYAQWMMRRGYFGHLERIRMNPSFTFRGEVLHRMQGADPTAKGIVRGWLNSPPHRRVLLNPRYRYIGIGQAQDRRITLTVGHFGAY